MKFNEYMQLEITPQSNKIQLSPIMKLNRKYEVGLLDVMYKHHSRKKLKLHAIDVINTTEDEMTFHLQVQKEGLVADNARSKFISKGFGFTPERVQAKEFDMWNYQVRERSITKLEIDPIITYFDTNPNATLTIHQIIELINDALITKSETFKELVRDAFLHTGGRDLIVTDRYFELPKLSIDTNRNMIILSLPYYVKKIEIAEWLNKLLGLFNENDAVFERKLFGIPSPLITGNFAQEKFNLLDRCQYITNVLPKINFEFEEGANIFIYCSLIEYRYIGNIKSPILRMFALSQNKKTINWVQFSNPHYFDLRYSEIGEFEIVILDEFGKKFDFEEKFYLTLHFREKK